MPFSFLAPKDFKIIWLSNILTLSVADEGYSRNASCTFNFLDKILLPVSRGPLMTCFFCEALLLL